MLHVGEGGPSGVAVGHVREEADGVQSSVRPEARDGGPARRHEGGCWKSFMGQRSIKVERVDAEGGAGAALRLPQQVLWGQDLLLNTDGL